MAKKGKVGTLDAITQYVKNKLPQTGFFSTMDELIDQAPFEKAPLQEWKNYLKPGRVFEREGVRFPLKQEELEYTFGDNRFQDPPTDIFTKEDLQKRLRELRPDLGLRVGLNTRNSSADAVEFRFPEEFKTERGTPSATSARYSDWAHDSRDYEESVLRSTDFGPSPTHHFGPDSISHSRTTLQKTLPDLVEDGDFSEYSKPKSLRLVEEIQSDRHQKAADRPSTESWALSHPEEAAQGIKPPRLGYRTREEEYELRRLQDQISGPIPDPPSGRVALYARRNELIDKVPDAPFKDPADYGLFELKNQMLNAAKEEQDYLGLVKGSDVSKRFSQGPEGAAGTSYIYDKVYRQQLDKLARQYGTNVRDVRADVREEVDARPPTMMQLGVEDIPRLIESALDDGGSDKSETAANFYTGLLDTLNEVWSEIKHQNNPALEERYNESRHLIALGRDRLEQDQDISGITQKIEDRMGVLLNAYKGQDQYQSKTKSFPAMELTPEVRERIKKAGVPIWALTGASLAGLGANEEEQGFAEGGEVTGIDRLRQIAENVGTEETVPRRKRILSGLASQWYGMNDKSGEPEFLGGDFAGYLPGVAAWRKAHGEPEYYSHGPGLLDEFKALGLGSKGADEADERLLRLKAAIRQKMAVEEAHGFQENFDESLGTMLGQFPLPGKQAAAKVAEKMALKQRLKKILKAVPDSAIEWFSPTINPSAGNYLAGATVGATAGAVADYFGDKAREEEQGEAFRENWNENNDLPQGWNVRFSDGGKVSNRAKERLERRKMHDEPYYDPQLAMRISRLLGPGFQSALDPKVKRYLPTHRELTLSGKYIYPGQDAEGFEYPYGDDERGAPKIDYVEPTPDTLYALGPTPSASTMAHEYRHRAGIRDEGTNRLYDAMYAETPEDWKEAVDFWYDWRLQQGIEITEEEAEADLLKTLERDRSHLRLNEWQRAPEDQKPDVDDPSVIGWITGSGGRFRRTEDLPYTRIKKAEGGKVEGTAGLQSMLSELRARLEELKMEVPQMSSVPDNTGGITEESLMKKIGMAKGGKVKTLLELREMLARNIESPNVEGTGREMTRVEPDSPLGPTANVPPPESIQRMVDSPPIPSVPFQVSRRDFLQGAAGLLSPVDVPLNPEQFVAKQLTRAVDPDSEWVKHDPSGYGKQPVMPESDDAIAALKDAHNFWYGESDEPNYPTVFSALSKLPGTDELVQKMERYRKQMLSEDWSGNETTQLLDEIDRDFDAIKDRYKWSDDMDEVHQEPHLDRAIEILNTADPNDARKYVNSLYEKGIIKEQEYQLLSEELEDMIDAEDFDDAE